jgi:competence protein ComGC
MSEPPAPEINSSGCRITLAGLMVIMVIVSVGSALLIPALNASKESACRTGCTNNLSMMYKAMHVYISDCVRREA